MGDRWQYVEPVGKSGGLLLGWGSEVTVHQIYSTDYSIEVEVESTDTNGRVWAIFIYASIREKVRAKQWQELWTRHSMWGDNWILGGDLNDIRTPEEKQGGRRRTEASCQGFKDFIDLMNMEELAFKGKPWTWANNWQDEGYIETRLDRFFGSS